MTASRPHRSPVRRPAMMQGRGRPTRWSRRCGYHVRHSNTVSYGDRRHSLVETPPAHGCFSGSAMKQPRFTCNRPTVPERQVSRPHERGSENPRDVPACARSQAAIHAAPIVSPWSYLRPRAGSGRGRTSRQWRRHRRLHTTTTALSPSRSALFTILPSSAEPFALPVRITTTAHRSHGILLGLPRSQGDGPGQIL